MRKNTVVYDFARFNIPVLLTFAGHVLESMTNNQYFSDAGKLLANLQEETESLKTHHQASMKGDREESALSRKSKEQLIKILKKLADMVDDIADGDETIIISSGFHLAKQPEVSARAVVAVEAGEMPGSVVLRRQADPEAKSYLWEKSLDGKVWEFAGVSGTTRHTISGLQGLTRYFFRVAVVTSDGTSAFSEPVSKVIE